MPRTDNAGCLSTRKPFDRCESLANVATALELPNDLASFLLQIGRTKETDRMAYSTAQRCFDANVNEMSTADSQTNVGLNLSKGLSELTVSLASDIQDLRTQLRILQKELDDLKSERRRVVI